MAAYTADSLSGGTTAGGVFNLTDAALIALILADTQRATDVAQLLTLAGAATTGLTEGQAFPRKT